MMIPVIMIAFQALRQFSSSGTYVTNKDDDHAASVEMMRIMLMIRIIIAPLSIASDDDVYGIFALPS